VRTSILLGLICFVVYNANLRAITAGDTYPARYLPFAIVQHGTLFLDPVVDVAQQGRAGSAYWMWTRPDGHTISIYPVVVPVLIAPLYVPAVQYLNWRGWTNARLDEVARLMEKLAASLIAALSVSLFYLLLRRRARSRLALLLAMAYAFGTTTWVISSQALWQHGVASLLVIGALLVLTGKQTTPRAIGAGVLLGLIAANRPPDAILAAALGAYGLWFWSGRLKAWLIGASALPAIAVVSYNFAIAGHLLGGYGRVGASTFFSHDLLNGVAGLLVSPARGLLLFSPFLLFLVLAWKYPPASREERGLTLAMTIAVVLQILLYAKADWRGGLSWGPRFLTELTPFLIWMLVPVVTALRGAGRVAFHVAVAAAIVIEGIGAFCYRPHFDLPLFTAEPADRLRMPAAWRLRNSPVLLSAREGLVPAELFRRARGSFDALEAHGRFTSTITSGEPVLAHGWALAGDSTPFQVAIVIDGRAPFASSTFFDRSDVRTSFRVASPSGWRIPIDTTGMKPGEYSLTALVWFSEKGEGHPFDQRRLIIREGTAPIASVPASAKTDLAASAVAAATRLREHQQQDGSWLTAYTSSTKYQDARPEMNTFLTALLVDVLDPLATSLDLDGQLQQARTHLTAQIEAGGLVRYHGRPDGPGIGTLGCAITPDTDDTALVWRIAPAPDRARRDAALATIDRYRTSEGLYRTWLAPRKEYQCLDPGSDPNPADIAIQMHLLLWLADVRPPAGRALCEALRPLVDEDRVWVYYRKAPLVPILRLHDMQRAGCALALPEPRMSTDVAQQQVWTMIARMLAQPATRDGASTDALLRQLARDDFAFVRTAPPLFYHNDLSATVPRYYWSEDLGYALWLRLYDRSRSRN
jgi:hypothetical protein